MDMGRLKLTLKLSDLGDQTHIWIPLPLNWREKKEIFSIAPTAIQTEGTYGNCVAYFNSHESDLTIEMDFPVSDTSSAATDTAPFLKANRYVQSRAWMISRIARNIAHDLPADADVAQACFDWVTDYLIYANPIRGLYSSIQALTDRRVDCGGFATLLVALLRSLGIPARCVFGWALLSRYGYHAWVEHYEEKSRRWIASDPSAAHLGKKTKLKAGFGFINDRRVTVSVGEDLLLRGDRIEWAVPLLQTPVVVSLSPQQIPVAHQEQLIMKAN